MKRSAVKEIFIIARMQERAKASAGKAKTGIATNGNLGVRYYPVCGRFAWFDENGPISKRLAIRLLNSK